MRGQNTRGALQRHTASHGGGMRLPCLTAPPRPPPSVQPPDGNKRSLNAAVEIVVSCERVRAEGQRAADEAQAAVKGRVQEAAAGSVYEVVGRPPLPVTGPPPRDTAQLGIQHLRRPAQCQVATQKGHSTLSLSRFSRGGNRAAGWSRLWLRRGSYTLGCST